MLLLPRRMLLAVASILVAGVGLANTRPVNICPAQDGIIGYGDESGVPLALSPGADLSWDVLLTLPSATRDSYSELVQCELLPGRTMMTSIVFQGSERWWFEVRSAPVTLLEVVCVRRTLSDSQLVHSGPSVMCASCRHGSDAGENSDAGAGNDTGEGNYAHRLGDHGGHLDSAESARRLRRSASSGRHAHGGSKLGSRPHAVAYFVIGVCSTVVGVFLAVLCASKSKNSDKRSKKPTSDDVNAAGTEEGTAEAPELRPNGTADPRAAEASSPGPDGRASTDGGREAAATPDASPAQASASTAPASPAKSTTSDGKSTVSLPAEASNSAAVGGTDSPDAPQQDPSDGGSTSTPGSPKKPAGDTDEPRSSPSTAPPPTKDADAEPEVYDGEEEEDGSVSPQYECIRQQVDDSIEESGDTMVVHHKVSENSDGYAYARVEGRPASDRAQNAAPDANDSDDQDPSYEAVIHPQPMSTRAAAPSVAPDSPGKAGRGRSASEISTLSHHSSKSSSLQRSLPEPTGTPAFIVTIPPIRPVTAPTKVQDLGGDVVEEEDDPTYSCVDAAAVAGEAVKKSRLESDPYARVDDNFRSTMQDIVDEPYSRAFDDISQPEAEDPYSRVGSGTSESSASNLPGGHAGDSLAAALAADGDNGLDDSYDSVFEVRRKSARAKQHPAGKTIPEEMEYREEDGGDGEITVDELYARPTKKTSQSVIPTRESPYEKPPELAPKQPGADVLESAVVHYEPGKEDLPLDGIPMHSSVELYAMPTKGKLERETAPKLEARTESSKELVLPLLDGGGYASVKDDELKDVIEQLKAGEEGGSKSSAQKQRKESVASVGSRAEEDDVETEHLYSSVEDRGLAEAKLAATATGGSTRPKRNHGYSRVTDDILNPEKKGNDDTTGDPGYQEVDAKLKEELARIRAESGGAPSPRMATPRTVTRARPQTARSPDEPPPEVPSTQRPRAATLDARQIL